VHQRQDDFGERPCEYVNRRGEDENAEICRQALQSYSKREGTRTFVCRIATDFRRVSPRRYLVRGLLYN
jgi:hypothetical protein